MADLRVFMREGGNDFGGSRKKPAAALNDNDCIVPCRPPCGGRGLKFCGYIVDKWVFKVALHAEGVD